MIERFFVGPDALIGPPRWFFTGEFRRLRAATFFFHGEKEGKTPPGTAQDERFALIFAFPRTPLRGLPL